MTTTPAYHCARCGRRLIRPGITDTAGAAFGPKCAEMVGLIVLKAKRKAKANGSRRTRVQADTRTVPLFEGMSA